MSLTSSVIDAMIQVKTNLSDAFISARHDHITGSVYNDSTGTNENTHESQDIKIAYDKLTDSDILDANIDASDVVITILPDARLFSFEINKIDDIAISGYLYSILKLETTRIGTTVVSYKAVLRQNGVDTNGDVAIAATGFIFSEFQNSQYLGAI